MKNVTIIGAGGFVGASLIESLVLDGHVGVRAVVRSYRNLAGFCQYGAAVDVRRANAEDADSLAEALEGSDTIVNVTTGPPKGIVRSTHAIYEACTRAKVKRLVHLSSAVVYGDVPTPMGDDDPPVSKHWMPYARAKAASEVWLRDRLSCHGLDVVVLRPGIVWGVRSPHTLDLAQSLAGKNAFLVDGGRGIFNGIYIDNLIACIRACCERHGRASGFYNVGDRESVTWRALFDALGPALGCDPAMLPQVDGHRMPRSAGSTVDTIQSLPLMNEIYHSVKAHIPDGLKAGIRSRLEGAYRYERQAPAYAVRPSVSRELWRLQRVGHKLPVEKFARTFNFSPRVSFDEGVRRTISWLGALGLASEIVPDVASAAETPMSHARKINVLDLRSCRGGGGGPEKTILFSALETDREAFNMSIAYLKSFDDPEFDLHKRAEGLGVESFYTIEEHHKFDLTALRQLLKLLRERQIDILHSHCYKSDLYGLILRRFHKMKLVTTAHGPLASFKYFWASKNWRVRYLYDQIDLRILKYFDIVFMVSDTMRGIIGRHAVAPAKMIWVRNAIDGQYFRRSGEPSAEIRSRLGIPAEAVVVGAVGRLNGEKDYPNLLGAAKLLLASRPDMYFVIAGKGELEQELRQMAADMGVAERVVFMGHFHDVRKVFEMMDVYVLSSTREGLPNTVLEAMAMEVPIVSTDVDGVREAVTGGSEAILVPAQSSEQLAAGIAQMLDDAGLRARLVRAARLKVESEFSFAQRTRRMEDMYRRLMSEGGTDRRSNPAGRLATEATGR